MRVMSRKAVACLTLPVMLAAALSVRAQDVDVPPLGEPVLFVPAVQRARAVMVIGSHRPDHVLTLFAATAKSEEPTVAAAVASVVGQGMQGPLVVWPTLLNAHGQGVVRLPEAFPPFEPDLAKPIEIAEPLLAHMIEGIQDDKPLPSRWNQNEDEQRSYNAVLFEASRIPVEAFRKGARADLTFAHLASQPSKYRGQVIHVEGLLRQLRHFDPPATAKAAGVTDLYEGWIFDPQRFGADPWCIVFTELPTGIQVGEKVSYAVAFDGYFFKRYSYESRGTRKGTKLKDWPTAPLLIGRTVTLTAATPSSSMPPPEADWAGPLIPVFLGLVIGSISLAFGLGWWFRRGDRRVRTRVAVVREREFEFNGEVTITSASPP
jgi:hypothetical protein